MNTVVRPRCDGRSNLKSEILSADNRTTEDRVMKHHSARQPECTLRRGSILIEAVVGAMILGVAMAMLVPGLTGIRRQRQALRFETLAMVELNNIAEFLPKLNPGATRTETVNPVEQSFEHPPVLSPWFTARYTNAELLADILPAADGATTNGLHGVRLTIHRPAFQSMPDQKVSVVVWQTSQENSP